LGAARTVLLCFPGYRGRFGGVEPERFRDYALGLSLFDQVEILEPDYRGWVNTGFQNSEFSNFLHHAKDLTNSGVTLFCFGLSVGAFVALRLAAASEAIGVLAIKPPVDISELRSSKGALADFTSLHSVRSSLPATLVVYSKADKGKAHDHRQATFFQGAPGAEVLVLESFGLLPALERGDLAQYFRRLVEMADSKRTPRFSRS